MKHAELRLWVQLDNSGDYWHVIARPVELDERGLWRRAGASFGLADGVVPRPRDEWRDLEIRCQGSPGEGTPYAFTIEYRDVFSVEHLRAERMVRMLRRIRRRMEALADRFGGVGQSFGQFAARAADVLGAAGFLIGDPGDDRRVTIKEGLDCIDQICAAQAQATKPKKAQ